jgi:anaerobic ribonucleoside-triphosphate reductase
MKYILFFLGLVLIANIACNKPSTEVFIAENPIDSFLMSTGYNQKDSAVYFDKPWEMGFTFTPMVEGNISALTIKLPELNHSLRVSIWDANTFKILQSEIVDIKTANTNYSISIEPLQLIKFNNYIISFLTKDVFVKSRLDKKGAKFPVRCGNVDITSINLSDGPLTISNTDYPYITDPKSYYGNLGFTFLQTK